MPRTRTSLYASYFLPSTLKLWNSLPPEIKDCPSLSILKSRLTSRVDHDNVPKYYYYGPRLTQILHVRLRMRSSSLNEHLYIKNIIDSPNCFCGEIESTHHYLFKCPKYTRQRNSLFRKLLQLLNIRPSENLLLFGSPLLFLRQCINIFRKANDFYKIHKTQIHHVIFYLECNLQFPSSFNFQLFKQC